MTTMFARCIRSGVVLLVALGYAGIAEPHALVGGLAVFHKQAFAHGAGGHGGTWKFSFQYPLSEWLPKAIPL